jgi:hypothetical protein
MKYILLNIKNLFKKDKLIGIIIVLCVFLSSLILNFSYGLYQNYNIKRYEENAELSQIVIEIDSNKGVYKKQFKEYIESLQEETLSDFSSIFIAGTLEECKDYDYNTLDNRFVYTNNKYSSPEILVNNLTAQKNITFGRYFSEQEEENGEKVAVVATDTDGSWNESSLDLKIDENHIRINGETYEVIGGSSSFGTPTIPFLSVSDDFIYNDIVIIGLNKVLSRSQYNEMKENAEIYCSDSLTFPDLKLPDTESLTIYRNIIFISLLMSLISIFNFVIIYRFIMEERKKQTAIFKIVGSNQKDIFLISFGECILLTVPVYIFSVLIYNFIIKKILSSWFEYMLKVYNLKIYLLLFLVYIISMSIIISFFISKNAKKKLLDMWRE